MPRKSCWIHVLHLLAILVVLSGLTRSAGATEVTPRPEVRHAVTVREEPTADSERVGALKPDEKAPLLGSVPSWYEVRLLDGRRGFVPKRWTVLMDSKSNIPFEVHFLDVGTGDSSILDMGDSEMVIDGGDSLDVLDDYAYEHGIIQGNIELLVVTHADTDHWRGLPRILGFDNKSNAPHGVDEFWEPGYNRTCRPLASFDTFIKNVKGSAKRFHRPLSNFHVSAVESGDPRSFALPAFPGVRFTVLHSDPNPSSPDCAYEINNASIVLLVEVDGVRILFTGDANGKKREGPSSEVGHVEQKLLALEARHPGVLRADILKVPHHGSETASTDAFIAKVSPKFVIVSASTKHQLPKATTMARYAAPDRTILRTDTNPEPDRDHIVCGRDEDFTLNCRYVEL